MLIELHIFWQIPDAISDLRRLLYNVIAIDGCRSRRGRQNRGQQANRCSFTGAIVTQKAKNLTSLNFKV
jgi:hypothetical protein